MKWPDNPLLTPEVVGKLNARLQRYLDEDPSPNGGADGNAVQELILDLYSIFSSCSGDIDEPVRQMVMIFHAMEWDTEDPKLVHAQKYLNRLGANRLQDASAYLDAAVNEQLLTEQAITREAMKHAGAKGGAARHQTTSAAIKAGLEYIKEHRADFRSKKAAARFLEEKFPPGQFSTFYRKLRKT